MVGTDVSYKCVLWAVAVSLGDLRGCWASAYLVGTAPGHRKVILGMS